MAIEYKLIPKRNPQAPEAAPKYYASPVYNKTITLAKLAKEVASRSTTASEGDVYSVLVDVRDLIRFHIGNSDRVCLDGIGTFEMGVSSDGAESKETFHPSLLKEPHVKFRPDTDMRDHARNMKIVRYVAQDEMRRRQPAEDDTAE